ncbi:MAG: hypothetical protein ACKOPS_26265, partial [Cyanobium sp.]
AAEAESRQLQAVVRARCGRPLGRGEAGGARRSLPPSLRGLRPRPWLPLLLMLLGISAGLAWLAESPQRSVPPAGRSGNG